MIGSIQIQTFAVLSYPLYFLQGLESYINNLPSKDELESLRVKLTQKTERNERLEAKIETLEGAHTGNSKLNYALQTQCKSLEEEVRLNQLVCMYVYFLVFSNQFGYLQKTAAKSESK